MGDRANVYIKNTDTQGVYLYGHFSGYDLPFVVQKALQKRWRWNDDQYLARIVFDVMVGRHQGEETGFGISAVMGDNSYPIIHLDCDRQTVSFVSPGNETKENFKDYLFQWLFGQYIELDEATLRNVWEEANSLK